jgi:hypothetical protein
MHCVGVCIVCIVSRIVSCASSSPLALSWAPHVCNCADAPLAAIHSSPPTAIHPSHSHASLITPALPRPSLPLQGAPSQAVRPMTNAGRPLTGFARPGTGSQRPTTSAQVRADWGPLGYEMPSVMHGKAPRSSFSSLHPLLPGCWQARVGTAVPCPLSSPPPVPQQPQPQPPSTLLAEPVH